MIENSLVKVWIKSYMGDELMKEVKKNEKNLTAYTPSPQKNPDKNPVRSSRSVFNC